jgi:hypothetical protein
MVQGRWSYGSHAVLYLDGRAAAAANIALCKASIDDAVAALGQTKGDSTTNWSHHAVSSGLTHFRLAQLPASLNSSSCSHDVP